MDGTEWVAIIGGLSALLVAVIGAVFSGLVALKQLPRIENRQAANREDIKAITAEVAEVKSLANIAADDRLTAANLAVAEKLEAAATALAEDKVKKV